MVGSGPSHLKLKMEASTENKYALELMQRMFEVDDNYKAKDGYGSLNDQTNREFALAMIKKYTRVAELDGTIGYRAITYFDRLASRTTFRQKKLHILVVSCFTISSRKSQSTFKLEEFLSNNVKDMSVSQVESMENYIVRWLGWNLESPVFEFLEYYLIGIGTTFVKPKLIKKVVIDSLQFMELTSFPPSVIAGGAIRLVIAADEGNAAHVGARDSVVNQFFSDDGVCGRFAKGIREKIHTCLTEMIELYVVQKHFLRLLDTNASEIDSGITSTTSIGELVEQDNRGKKKVVESPPRKEYSASRASSSCISKPKGETSQKKKIDAELLETMSLMDRTGQLKKDLQKALGLSDSTSELGGDIQESHESGSDQLSHIEEEPNVNNPTSSEDEKREDKFELDWVVADPDPKMMNKVKGFKKLINKVMRKI